MTHFGPTTTASRTTAPSPRNAGEVVKLAFGDDAGGAMRFVNSLVAEGVISPPEGMDYKQTTEAVRGLAWLQHAAKVGESPLAAAGAQPPNMVATRRYARFALSIYGHLFLRFLRILPVVGGPASDLDAIEHLTGIPPRDVRLPH